MMRRVELDQLYQRPRADSNVVAGTFLFSFSSKVQNGFTGFHKHLQVSVVVVIMATGYTETYQPLKAARSQDEVE